MILKQGNMWDAYEEVTYFIVTTNATVTKDGRLVMGRGIAKQAVEKFPGIDYEIGEELPSLTDEYGRYGCLIGEPISIFQVKTFWGNPADLGLIEFSTNMLNFIADKHAEATFALNFPGIGNGGLRRELVLPIIQTLPDNVQVWEYGPSTN